MHFRYELRIAKERIAVLIGQKGQVKAAIERKLRCKLRISPDGEVSISAANSVDAMIAQAIIAAIGQGFSPDRAMVLESPEMCYESVAIADFAKNKQAIARLRGRVIGAQGRARRNIEALTGCSLVVGEKEIGIIGQLEEVQFAKRAVEAILRGAPHAKVWAMLERETAGLKRKAF